MEWKEITQDNCDTVYELNDHYYLMFAWKSPYQGIIYGTLQHMGLSIGTMAKSGNYYYIVLPKLY